MSLNVVITGANRGIGLSFCKHYSDLGYTVYGICRTSSPQLDTLAGTVIDGIDISDANSCNTLSEKLSNVKIDLLINNAGILANEIFGHLDYETIEMQFRVNALGTLRITEKLRNKLSSNAKIAILTSRMGSIEDNQSGNYYGYRMSKAALNAIGKSLAIDFAQRKIPVGIYHPGYVTTDMTGGNGDITPDQSTKKLAGLIDILDMTNTGTFWHSNGEILPW